MGVGKYCAHSPNFFGWGVGEEKDICAQTGMLRAEGNFSKSLCKYRLDIKAIKLAVVHHQYVSFVPISKPSLS